MISNKKELELGYAGLALLRNRLVGDKNTTEQIAREISKLAEEIHKETPSETKEIKRYDVASGYKAWSDTYDNIPNILLEVEEPVVKSILKDFKRGKALDVACGTGRYSQILYDLGHEVVGIDSTLEMLHHAKSRVPRAEFIHGDLEKLPINSESVDLVICALALTHLPSVDKTISELNRVVRPQGYIVLSDIHPWFVIIGGQAEFQDINGEKGYIFNYIHQPSRYLEEFNKLGLKIKKCIEPTLDSKHLNPTEVGLNLSKKTMDTALEGLPLALVWVLEKPNS